MGSIALDQWPAKVLDVLLVFEGNGGWIHAAAVCVGGKRKDGEMEACIACV